MHGYGLRVYRIKNIQKIVYIFFSRLTENTEKIRQSSDMTDQSPHGRHESEMLSSGLLQQK